MRQPLVLSASTFLLVLVCASAEAHPNHAAHGSGFTAGLLHPLLGLDHLLAMAALGLWSAQLGGRALWALPCAFVGSMLAGGVCGVLGWTMPAVEYAIALSVLLLGLALMLNRRQPWAVPLTAAMVFGFFHGHAHGTEMPAFAAPALYALGFVAATIGLHAAGVFAGCIAVGSKTGELGLRISGAAIAAAGLLFLLK